MTRLAGGPMTKTNTRAVLGIAAFLGAQLSTAPTAFAAITKDQCVDSNRSAQELRSAGRLADAKLLFRTCADPACPTIVRADCQKRMDELTQSQPTIVFEAKDEAGNDVIDVTVTVDDKPFASSLDGTALPVDVGKHVFAFLVADHQPIKRTFAIREAEKSRHERIVLVGTARLDVAQRGEPTAPTTPVGREPAPLSLGDQATPGSEPPPSRTKLTTVFGFGAAGLGVAGLGLGAVFGAEAFAQRKTQIADCNAGTSCSKSSLQGATTAQSAVKSDSTASTVSFIVGGLFAAAGATVLLVGSRKAESTSASQLAVVPAVAPGSLGVDFWGRF